MPDWVGPVARYVLETGLPETLRLAVTAVAASTLVGIALGTLLTLRLVRIPVRLYVEVWRGLPILVTVFLVYFALPSLGLRFGAFTAAAIGLTLWGSAQVAEATRGAVQSIPREQHDAASALGFSWVGRHRRVILPQAFRRLLPPLVSLQANVIQNTTIAAVIGVAETLEAGNRQTERLLFSSSSSHSLEIFGGVMALFFVISFPLTRLAAHLERRLV
ncbi:MAG TPA: amino acid ABC transporter permease [Gaiellaceae bacterium]|jgi:polar amino acid transport system permease protein